MLKCEDCGFTIKCCALVCPKCSGELLQVEHESHYWDWDGNVLVCQNTNNQTSMPINIMEELPYCPFCKEELPRPNGFSIGTRGDAPPETRTIQTELKPILKL